MTWGWPRIEGSKQYILGRIAPGPAAEPPREQGIQDHHTHSPGVPSGVGYEWLSSVEIGRIRCAIPGDNEYETLLCPILLRTERRHVHFQQLPCKVHSQMEAPMQQTWPPIMCSGHSDGRWAVEVNKTRSSPQEQRRPDIECDVHISMSLYKEVFLARCHPTSFTQPVSWKTLNIWITCSKFWITAASGHNLRWKHNTIQEVYFCQVLQSVYMDTVYLQMFLINYPNQVLKKNYVSLIRNNGRKLNWLSVLAKLFCIFHSLFLIVNEIILKAFLSPILSIKYRKSSWIWQNNLKIKLKCIFFSIWKKQMLAS